MKAKLSTIICLTLCLLLCSAVALAADHSTTATIDLIFDGMTFTDSVQVEWNERYPVPEGGIKWDGTEQFNYIPPIDDDDLVTISKNGYRTTYLKNQLMLLSKSGESIGYYFDAIEQLAAKYNARIVGYIAMQETYQIEFIEDLSFDELNLLIEELENNAAVLPNTVSLCYVYDIIDNNIADYWGGSGKPSTTEVSGNNWGVEYIGVPSLWNYSNYMDVVEVVVHDSGFGKNDDVVVHEIFNSIPEGSASPITSGDHSLHVAGIIGASHNGEVGIDGVFPKARIYGYSHHNQITLTMLQRDIQDLINNEIKVFNLSWGFDQQTQIDAFNDSTKAYERQSQAWNLGQALSKLIDNKKDFVIVCSAGNYGYSLDALYNGFFPTIPRAIVNDHDLNKVVDRIIVVGAISQNGYAEFSQSGNRVDILAPGVDILSTVSNNCLESKSGTSMAAPHVTGVAAMIWSLNKNLKGYEVKNYILSTLKTLQPLSDDPNRSTPFPVLDAPKSIETMLGELGQGFFSCYITDDKTATALNTMVTLIPKGANQVNTITQSTDATGRFHMIIPSGHYELRIDLEGYWPYIQDIIIPQGVETKINIALKTNEAPEITKGTLNGTVTLNSNGVNGIEVDVTSGTNHVVTLITNEAGQFATDLEPGAYVLSIDADGYVPVSKNTTVFVGKTTTENIELDDSMYATVKLSIVDYLNNYHIKIHNAKGSVAQIDFKLTLVNNTVLYDTAQGIINGSQRETDGFRFVLDDELIQGSELVVTSTDGNGRHYEGSIILGAAWRDGQSATLIAR